MITDSLLKLAHELGQEHRKLAILGEGNVSARIDEHEFLVKASGSTLATLAADELTRCKFETLLPMLADEGLGDSEIHQRLMASRSDGGMRKPSVEALFHALLLQLPEINFVGHVHPEAVNVLLCGGKARDFAEKRLFPDQIVCCGRRSLVVAYEDPGLALAVAIRQGLRGFLADEGIYPQLILIENHGLIALGRTANEVLAATLMAEKAARIFVACLSTGEMEPVFLTQAQVDRIAGRPDEHYRQQVLNA